MKLNASAQHGRAYVLLSLTTLCWGANAVFGRMAVGEISPMVLVTLRWGGALALMLLFAHRHLRRDWPVLRRNLRFTFILGSLGFTAFNAFFYVAAQTTGAINIGIIQGSIPVFVLLGVFFAYGQRISPMQLAGVIITLIGVVTVASDGSFSKLVGLMFKQGDVLMVIACSLYAGYAVALQRRPHVSSMGLFTMMAGAAFLASLPLLLVEAGLGSLQWPTPKGWLIAALITVFPSFIAQIFFLHSVQLIGPGRAGVFVNLVPVFASAMAVTLLHENFQFYHGLALLLVLGGIALSERSAHRKHQATIK